MNKHDNDWLKEIQTTIEQYNAKKDFTGIHTLKAAKNKTHFNDMAGILLDYEIQFGKVTRSNPYFVKHDDSKRQNKTNRNEERIAALLVSHGYKFSNGSIAIDFQVPLKDKKRDKVGKIDILAYNAESRKIFVMELKRPDNDESILRCVLEAYSYSKIVDSEKLISDWHTARKSEIVKIDVADDAMPSPCALIFKGSLQHKQYMDPQNQQTRNLIEKLKVEVETIDAYGLIQSLPETKQFLPEQFHKTP